MLMVDLDSLDIQISEESDEEDLTWCTFNTIPLTGQVAEQE